MSPCGAPMGCRQGYFRVTGYWAMRHMEKPVKGRHGEPQHWEATSMGLKSVCERAVNSAPLQTHSATGPEFNDGDECNQNKDHQYHDLRDRERWFRLCRSQRIEG
jgi:hypothetical protein